MKKVGLLTLGLLVSMSFSPVVQAETFSSTTTSTSSGQTINVENEESSSDTLTNDSSNPPAVSSTNSSSDNETGSVSTTQDSSTANSGETPPSGTQDIGEKKPTSDTETQDLPEVDWIEAAGYFTVNDPEALFNDPQTTQPATGITAGQTLQILRSSEAVDGHLLELTTNTGQLIYGKDTAGTFAADAFGTPTLLSGYLVISDTQAVIWQDAGGSKVRPATDFLKSTLTITAQARHFNGTTFYQVSSGGKVIGWLPQFAATLTDAQGTYRSHGRYLYLKNSQTVIWKDFTFKNKHNTAAFLNRVLLAKGIYYHANGKNYLSVYEKRNGKDTWVGYVEEASVTYTAGPQGNYQNDGRYATIKSANYTIWGSFNWTKKNTSKSVMGQTFRAKGQYKHFNGSTYLSLYDNKNNWVGYINATGVTLTSGAQGSWQQLNKYVTVTSKNYTLWSSFSWNAKQKSSTLATKTYLAKGQYRHFNGSTYYSLYDNKNKWQGYLNVGGAKVANGQQGIWQKSGQQVILTKQNWSLWQNFSWKKKASSSSYRSKLFTAQGYYRHFNGSKYLSLYDEKGKWYGYINADATKTATSTKSKLSKVQTMLNKKYKAGNVGIYVMSLTDGQTAQINGNQSFMAASTGKLPVLYYTQKLINEKKLDPKKLYTYTDKINTMSLSYMRGGAGILQGKPFGGKYSLDTIMNWTCKYSDNQGANFLGYYGANQYDQKMKNEISRVVGRKWDRFRYVSAKENALLLKEMYHNGGKVLDYLSNTTYDSQRLPKYLPVRVAHKIGDLYGYAHDCGIVYTKQPYIICVMTNNSSYETISKISKDVYDIMK